MIEIRKHPDGRRSLGIILLIWLPLLVIALLATSPLASCIEFDIYANIPLGGNVTIGPSIRVGHEGVVGAGFKLSIDGDAPTWTGITVKPVFGCTDSGWMFNLQFSSCPILNAAEKAGFIPPSILHLCSRILCGNENLHGYAFLAGISKIGQPLTVDLFGTVSCAFINGALQSAGDGIIALVAALTKTNTWTEAGELAQTSFMQRIIPGMIRTGTRYASAATLEYAVRVVGNNVHDWAIAAPRVSAAEMDRLHQEALQSNALRDQAASQREAYRAAMWAPRREAAFPMPHEAACSQWWDEIYFRALVREVTMWAPRLEAPFPRYAKYDTACTQMWEALYYRSLTRDAYSKLPDGLIRRVFTALLVREREPATMLAVCCELDAALRSPAINIQDTTQRYRVSNLIIQYVHQHGPVGTSMLAHHIPQL